MPTTDGLEVITYGYLTVNGVQQSTQQFTPYASGTVTASNSGEFNVGSGTFILPNNATSVTLTVTTNYFLPTRV